jgi:succinate dehydrogenase / fumarate reductase cytochrome b subunit
VLEAFSREGPDALESPMNWFFRGLRTTVGLKLVMGTTGVLLFLFVLAHMLGNLQVFAGPEQLNAYAEHIQDLGPLLWVARVGLLFVFVVHVSSAVALTLRNRAARPVPNQLKRPLASTYASRTMFMSGLVVLAFLVYHLAHLTFGLVDPSAYTLHDAQGRHDVYSMVVRGFQHAPIAVSYVVAMALLAFHLKHGIASLFQSLGFNQPKYRALTERIGLGAAWIVFLGNVSMPLAALFGVVRLPGGGS